ncbi:hypothetical protein FD755_023661, partial [Muntiacus reevesi]
MHSNTVVTPDPEAQRSPASPGRVCNPLPWALSAALLLLAAACATCLVRFWGVLGTPASPVSSPAPSSILPVGLEQTSDPHARLPNSPQQGVFAQLVVADGDPRPLNAGPGSAQISAGSAPSYRTLGDPEPSSPALFPLPHFWKPCLPLTSLPGFRRPSSSFFSSLFGRLYLFPLPLPLPDSAPQPPSVEGPPFLSLFWGLFSPALSLPLPDSPAT